MPKYRGASVEIIQIIDTHITIRLPDGQLDVVPYEAVTELTEENQTENNEQGRGASTEESLHDQPESAPVATVGNTPPTNLDYLWMRRHKNPHPPVEVPPRAFRRRGGGW